MNMLDIPIERADLETLDTYLSSERSPKNGMMLSDLDGFLTGIAIGPELVMPSEWLPIVWGEEEPTFADETEAKVILGSIMARFNEILRQIEKGIAEPIVWMDRDDKTIADDWAAGFMEAVGLRLVAWKELLLSKHDGYLLFPILALCRDENGKSPFGIGSEDAEWAGKHTDGMLPACITAIAAYWRINRADSPFVNPNRKVGRNDPCPCDSGRKFKKCCGRND